eukprot:GHVN01064182.1.p2 GENE.GHVN01064182.1~~GHVN01064182.1.p2  ORF type:complete len:100 (-),score=6.12 GHVN01064182.1:311-610(-)
MCERIQLTTRWHRPPILSDMPSVLLFTETVAGVGHNMKRTVSRVALRKNCSYPLATRINIPDETSLEVRKLQDRRLCQPLLQLLECNVTFSTPNKSLPP